MKTWHPGLGEIEQTVDPFHWYESHAVIYGPKETKTQRGQHVIEWCLKPSSSTKPASFDEPVSKTRCCYRFGLRCFRVRGCTAASRSSCNAVTGKKNRHPWYFRCWSPMRNELECPNLVHRTEELHRFSSRDATIVVGSVLVKHFDGDFTPDQGKEIIFKRWPPG